MVSVNVDTNFFFQFWQAGGTYHYLVSYDFLMISLTCLRMWINQNHMCEKHYRQHSWQSHTRIFHKTYHKHLHWKEEDLILILAEIQMVYQRRHYRNSAFLFFVFFRSDNGKKFSWVEIKFIRGKLSYQEIMLNAVKNFG